MGTFLIPPGTKGLYLMPSASGVSFEMGLATGPTGSTFQTNAGRAAQLDGPNLISGPFKCETGALQNTVVSIWNPTGNFVSVRVYATVT